MLALAVIVTDAAPAASVRQTGLTCRPGTFPGLAVQFSRLHRQLSSLDPATADAARSLRAGLIADVRRVARAILGWTPDWPDAFEGWAVDVGGSTRPAWPCLADSTARDRQVWSMSLAGYSAQEIADVLEGHLTLADVTAARALLMAGHPPSVAVALLEARWRPSPPLGVVSPGERSGDPRLALPPAVDRHVEHLSRVHGIDPALIRAVIAAESGGNPRAFSPAGAIGLMQLMPGTAAELQVDPWNPLENIRGGIAYLAGLLRAYGDPILALVAYNAGPQHADRVRAGRSVPYAETRRYLDAIRARYPLPLRH
jgi:soluble lytic murein transglycosylase-like protein